MGGRVAFLTNVVLPVSAAISFYGGGIAPNPFSPGLLDRAGDLHAPQMLLWGGLDKHIGPELTRAVTEALRAAGKPFVNVEFSDADHGFFCDARSSYNPNAARQAWALVLAFLNILRYTVAGSEVESALRRHDGEVKLDRYSMAILHPTLFVRLHERAGFRNWQRQPERG